MPHILVAGKLHPSGLKLLEEASDFSFDYIEEVSEESIKPHIHKAEALLLRTQPLGAETIGLAGKLKIVSRHGVGYDAVNLNALNTAGITLSVVGDVNSVSVAEHAIMMILATSKRLIESDTSVRNGKWEWRNKLLSREIYKKNLLIVGYGRIGRLIAKMAIDFGMNVKAYDPYLLKQGWPEGKVSSVADFEEGGAWADFVSISAPRADKPLIGAKELAQMKHGVIIVNTARGGIVDEPALIAALQSGQVAAAGIDVFDDEPVSGDNLLFEMDQVILSPHIAGLTSEAAEGMATSSVQNILDFFAGRLDPCLVVNGDNI